MPILPQISALIVQQNIVLNVPVAMSVLIAGLDSHWARLPILHVCVHKAHILWLLEPILILVNHVLHSTVLSVMLMLVLNARLPSIPLLPKEYAPVLLVLILLLVALMPIPALFVLQLTVLLVLIMYVVAVWNLLFWTLLLRYAVVLQVDIIPLQIVNVV